MLGLGRAARTAAVELARAVVPVSCPGCGALDVPVCGPCAGLWSGPLRRCEAGAPRLDRPTDPAVLPVWALTAYQGAARSTVVAWKDGGRRDLPLAAALGAAAASLAPALLHGLDGVPGPIAVVPVPSSAAARRARGADLVHELARCVAVGLGHGGLTAEVVPALRRGRGRDQVGLGVGGRAVNAAAVRARRSHTGGRGAGTGPAGTRRDGARPCLVVDDVLTTGATVAACVDVLRTIGLVPVGTLVLAATPSPVHRSG